ncbi:NahK/ErcS family hybrid sensor histidine kinase/response regulator [Azospirillum sp.]|uniref:NahK/ErcS family hybrid sensor histidine kinase/response regulator n=1 Tax=Azospirillum sp. TaxID=34012 RepID=UPI002D60385D|nr:NahK/ErcS family hybrid sensor histidine kinase/response regulator [Azospirillum sp.]HYD65392.1 NahK/ErcS family hybrid sensor histidine kinase/response regulator [Azospirillum sp.]
MGQHSGNGWTRGLWSALLALLLLLALPVAAQEQLPPPPEPSSSSVRLSDGATKPLSERADFWRHVREGTEGAVNQPNRGVLIQRQGADWGSVRTELVATYGKQLIAVCLAVMAAFLLLHGRFRAFAGMVGDALRHLRRLDRVAYWLTAVSFLLLGVSGLTILYGRRMIAPLIGKETFATLAYVSKAVHDTVSWAFLVGVALLILMWLRSAVTGRSRPELPLWTRRGPTAKGSADGDPQPAALGHTERLVFWSAIGGGIIVSYSGLALLFPLALVELQRMQLMQIVHSVSSMTLAALIFGHVLIAAISIRENARKLTEAKEVLEQRVSERTQALHRVNDMLRQEIRERREIEIALEIARNEAVEANRSKDRFLATASHDLLQPLSAARLMVSTLRERAMRPENRDLVDRIHVALSGAEDLLADLLDISKLDAGGVTARVAEVPVDSLLESLATEFAPVAREAGLELRTVPCRLVVRTDPHLLLRILRNLLSNAVRYTREGRVLIGCRRRGDALRFDVWDTGIGIPADRQQAIFAEFHREAPAAGLHGNGAGLGLAIVDRIARVLEHPVEVRSVPGRGSVFSVAVPVAAGVTAAALAQPFNADNDLAGTAILAVDNDEHVLVGLTALLEQWGCTVLAARNPYEALAAARKRRFTPDLVVTDYHLDHGDTGLEFVRRARAELGGVPAVIITADRSPETRARITAAGVQLLNKPVKPAKLRALVSHAVARVPAAE